MISANGPPRRRRHSLDHIGPLMLGAREAPCSRAAAYDGVDRRDAVAKERVVRRLLLEYEEMPGLSLTAAQTARLLVLRREARVRILNGLVRDGILQRARGGQYVRTVVR